MCLAIPGKVLPTEYENGRPVARVQFGDSVRTVRLDFLPEATVGIMCWCTWALQLAG